jgi:hypothetical protein
VTRVLITGSRTWTDWPLIRVELRNLVMQAQGQEIVVVHGAARGADTIAGAIARRMGLTVEEHPVTHEVWARVGRRAGHVRNAHMVALGADLCLAFLCPCVQEKCNRTEAHPTHGAEQCVKLARDAGIPVREVPVR